MTVLWSNPCLDAVKSDGTAAVAVKTGAAKGCTLAAGTWYFVLGETVREVGDLSAHLKWAAAAAGTAKIEFCDFPATEVDGETADITGHSSTAGDWIPQDPDDAYVAVTGSGNSSTGAVVTLGGSAAGGCTFELPSLGVRRARIELVLSVGGLVRCAVNAKE
jgi:hypothetical protein